MFQRASPASTCRSCQTLDAMNTRELAQRLFEEGCNPSSYAVGSRGGASDAFCLTFTGTQWQVFYTERGQDSPPIYASGSESQACEFFFHRIMAMRHDHCVGFFASEHSAVSLKATLQEFNVSSWIDRIPYGGPNDPRYRVFVTGKAIFSVKAALGSVPIRDNGV
jgi:hypothetical protein